MFYWARVLLKFQISLSAVIALLLSIAPLAGSVFGAGPQIAFESDRDGNWEIYLMDVDRQIDHNLTRSPADDHSPSWSNDGSSLVFYSNRDGEQKSDLYIIDVIRGTLQRLTDNTDNNIMPTWSPDGQHIVYVMNFGNMIVMNADGSNPHGLGFGFRPSWSADSQHVIYYADPRNDLNQDIYQINVKNFVILNLSQNRATDWDPASSPDGSLIAFASVRSTTSDIYLMDVCVGSNTAPCAQSAYPLTHNQTDDISPAWSNDSREIAFTSSYNQSAQIFIVNRDGSDLRQLTEGRSNNRLPAWRPVVNH